jgi:hypothetical protein
MHSQQLICCAILVGVFAVGASLAPASVADWWRKLERGLQQLAHHRTLCWIGIGVLVLAVRATLLPVWPIPKASVFDEFGYLLQADTFAHGRLTNPPHPLWQFFESIYILQQPTYASKYPPAQSFVLALGQVIFGHPWLGVWLSAGLLAGVICWALQGWLPPGWALFGAFIGLDLCLFSYWMNSYWGGAVAAIGGGLVTGALVRITRRKQWQYAWLFGIGAVIVVLARPFEGSLFLLVALITLAMANRTPSVWLPIMLIGVAGASWLAYDNYRITGHPLRLPYFQYHEQYDIVPPFSFMPLSTAPQTLRHFYLESRMLDTYGRVRSWRLFVDRPIDWLVLLRVYYGNLIWLFPLVAFASSLWYSRRTRFATVLVVVMVVASVTEVWWYPHYAAPLTAALFILVVQSLRYLRQWKYHGREVGRFLVRATPAAVAVIMLLMESRGIATYRVQAKTPTKEGMEETLLAQRPGRHVIFVRYREGDTEHREWVYNPADIDAAPVVWAHDLGPNENERLMHYYAGRSFWRFEPYPPMRFQPY